MKGFNIPPSICFRKIQNLELYQASPAWPSPLPRYPQLTSSWTWGTAPSLPPWQACCRSPHCIHCPHHTRGPAVSRVNTLFNKTSLLIYLHAMARFNHYQCFSTPPLFLYSSHNAPVTAGVQPRLIQGIRSGDGVGDLFIYSSKI